MMAPGRLLLEFSQKRDQLNILGRKLAGIPVYGSVEMAAPKWSHSEVGFLRVVAWLYVHHQEAGTVSIRFLIGLFDGYGIDSAGDAREHSGIVAALRTELQHNLLPQSDTDLDTQIRCAGWYLQACGTRSPGNASHWKDCLISLLREAVEFVETLDRCLRCLEIDDTLETQVEIWKGRVSRDHRPHEYDRVIQKVVADIGRDELDVVAFRSRHIDRWRREIASLAGGYDFEREARRLVEGSVIKDSAERLPVTGTEIMKTFGLGPGRRIGELLQRAYALYNADPCDGNKWLERLHREVEE